MNKKFRKLILPLSIFATLQAQSMGLGTLQVQSMLDEELKGSIPLVLDGTEDLETLKVSLASEDDYQKVGLDKSYVPSNIHVKLSGDEENKSIEITSKGPVSEPIVSLLIVVDWSNGHLLREYTLLLDPPIFNNAQIQKNYSDPVKTQTYEAPKQIESSQITESNTNTSNISDASNSFSSSNQVVVEAGDTLWKIATRYNSGFSSPQQMMVAIFNNNPNAFQNNDMNFLKKGAVLEIPNSDDVSLISKGEAIEEVKNQTSQWSRLNSQEDTDSSNTQSSVDYGIELVPPNDSDTSDSTSTSGSGSQANAKIRADLKRAREELASSTLENEELSSRVLELEQIVKDQEMALSLKDDDLALLQKQLTETNSDASSDNMTDDVWDSTDDSGDSATDSMNDDVAINDTMSDDGLSEDTMQNDNMADDSMTTEASSEDSNEVKIADVNESSPNQDNKSPEIKSIQPTTQEKSLMDKILDFKTYIMAGLGVLLLAIIGLVFYKRKSSQDSDPESGSFYENESNQEEALDNFNSPQSELNLSNLDDELENELEVDLEESLDEDFDESLDEDLEENLEDEMDLSLDSEPEVIVMDESDADDLEIDDIDLDMDDLNSLEAGNDDVEQENTELTDLEFNVDDLALDDETSSEDDADESQGSEDEFDDLSLDFDLDELDSDNKEETIENDDSSDALLSEDFNLDLASESDESELEDVIEEGQEIEDLVFDTGERTIVPDASETEETIEDFEFDLGDDMFSTDDLDLDSTDNTEDSDIGSDDTELNDTEISDLEVLNATSIPTDEDEAEFDLGLDFDEIVEDDAIDTKLDLAKAYFEMGDIDGARQMVSEIIIEGNDDQKSKAEKLKEEIENT